MDEQRKYEVIKRLVEDNGNKDRAAMTLGVTRRHVNRLILAYKNNGKAAFAHGNRGRKPATTIPDDIRASVVNLYRDKYYGTNFTHFAELLADKELIRISARTLASIPEAEYIFSPRVTKAKKKRIRKELEQMDASPYVWFGTEKTMLHIAVDDATGMITGAYFDRQETLNGYYNVLVQILRNYGIPYRLFTDRRTVFTYKKKNAPDIGEDTCTQFAYCCKQLGIQIEYSSVPQAKGRVERMFETLQSRLPAELRLAGITDIDAANEFLESYVTEFNARFSLRSDCIKSVFEAQPSEETINLTLAVPLIVKVNAGPLFYTAHVYLRRTKVPDLL